MCIRDSILWHEVTIAPVGLGLQVAFPPAGGRLCCGGLLCEVATEKQGNTQPEVWVCRALSRVSLHCLVPAGGGVCRRRVLRVLFFTHGAYPDKK